jgi:hypothetical protein
MLFNGCEDVELFNVHVHHVITDCFMFTEAEGVTGEASLIACKRVAMTNCAGEYGARYNLGCEQLRQAVFTNCRFDYAGNAAYGTHAGVGIAVDPSHTAAASPPNDVDVDTGMLTFINCTVNYGLQAALTTTPGAVRQVRFVDCEMIADPADAGAVTYWIKCDSARVAFENCYADAYDRIIGFGTIGASGQSFSIIGNELRGKARAFYSGADYPCNVERNRFICTETAAQTYPNLKFLYNVNTLCRFRNNYTFIPKEAYTPINHAGGNDFMSVVWMQFAELVDDNKWETDLPANQNGATAAVYDVLYDSARKVRNERFKGTNPGAADTFKPNPSTGMNTLTTDYSN